MNLAAAALLGIDGGRVVGLPFRGYVEKEDRRAFADHLHFCAVGAGPVCSELRLRGRDRQRIPAQVFSAAAHLGRRGPSYRTALIDVADLRRPAESTPVSARNEAAPRNGGEAEDRFLAVLSHELRNQLMPIQIGVQILERAEPGSKSFRDAREVLARQVRRSSELIDDLLDLSRIGSGKMEIRRRVTELADLVRAAVDDHRAVFERHGIRLAALCVQSLLAEVDPVRITQVLANLLSNAAKFARPGGVASVSLVESGGYAVLTVRDSGVGIAPEVLPRVFDAFVQAESSSGRQAGLGLGLAIVKSIVELHEGTVTARSEGLGRGTELVVRLPLVERGSRRPW
jgi:signal transduction histidine kinase